MVTADEYLEPFNKASRGRRRQRSSVLPSFCKWRRWVSACSLPVCKCGTSVGAKAYADCANKNGKIFILKGLSQILYEMKNKRDPFYDILSWYLQLLQRIIRFTHCFKTMILTIFLMSSSIRLTYVDRGRLR